MQYKIITQETFSVAGISTRTTNENSQAQKDLGELWNKFYFDNISGKITQKLSDDIICLYTDYEKDFTKPYSVILGHKVNNIEVAPKTMVGKTVPTSKYAVFHIEGQPPQEIITAWKWIWESDLERTYTGDFEVYKKENEADIYVAIK